MLQQTPVARVEPVWREWMSRWPTPADLAAEPPGEAVRAWGRLGYPRRALRLHATAVAIASEHQGGVPLSPSALLALPGVGRYTAAAVAAFAGGAHTVVVDTNIRRVLTRIVSGVAAAAPTPTAAEWQLAQSVLPDPERSPAWNVAVMEFGALVCAARSPLCGQCPVTDLCQWRLNGYPAYEGPPRRTQGWAGTDRQARGALLAVLRCAAAPVARDELLAAWPKDPEQAGRALASLEHDGLAAPREGARYSLPQ